MSPNDLKNRIEEIVEKHREEIIKGLSELLKFNTVSGATDEEGTKTYKSEIERCLAYLQHASVEMGFEWKNYDNLVAYTDYPAGSSFIALPVHIDVVPPGDGWKYGPFDGTVAEDIIWGRGCQDDKGPVIQMLWAMNVLKMLDLPLKRGVRMIIGTTEECGDWIDIKHYFEVDKAPEFSIVPDAAFPIINGEKGLVNLKVEADLLADPSSNVGGYRLASAIAGERSNIVPPRAELRFSGDADADFSQLQREVERFLHQNPEAKAEVSSTRGHDAIVTFHGKSAHGSLPQEGHSAAVDMLKYITESGFVSDDEADLAMFLYECGSDLTGGRLGLSENHSFIGPTTVNLGILRWEGPKAHAIFNTRNTMGLSVAETIRRGTEKVMEFATETGFSMSANANGKALEPIYVDPAKHPEFISALKEAYTTVTDREATLHAMGGTTYAKAFPNAVCFGPVDMSEEEELAHQVDERVSVDHHLRNVKIYAYAVAKLCAQ
jgi:succinyl-diaminopimelate desuccinylase